MQFRWLFASNIGFFFAMGAQMIVRSIIAFDLTRSPLALGIINFAVAIPMMVVSPLGGVVADRVERRRLILIGQGILVSSEVAVLSLLVLGELQFWHLVAAASLIGCTYPFIMPASSALVVDIIGKRGLQNALALQMGGMNATRILGPAVAGFLIPLVGLAGAFAFGSALYVVAMLCLLGVERSPPPAQLREASVLGDLVEGVRYMAHNRVVLMLLLFGIVPMFLAMPFQTLLVVFTEEVWMVGSRGLGTLHAVAGIGGLIGSAYLAQRSDALGRLSLMVASAFAFAFFLLLFALSPYFLLALPLVLIANIAASIFNTLKQHRGTAAHPGPHPRANLELHDDVVRSYPARHPADERRGRGVRRARRGRPGGRLRHRCHPALHGLQPSATKRRQANERGPQRRPASRPAGGARRRSGTVTGQLADRPPSLTASSGRTARPASRR